MKPIVKQKQPVVQYAINNALTGGGGGGTQVQANWNETDTTAPSYIQNKPDLSNYATTTDISDMATETWVGSQGYLTSADEVPTVESTDNKKVLTATYVNGTPGYQWKYLLPSISASDDEKLVRVAGNGYSYVSSYRLLPPTITSSDAGKVLVARYNSVSPDSSDTQWGTPPMPKYVTQLDSNSSPSYTLGSSLTTDGQYGFVKFIVYGLSSGGGGIIPGDIYEGYMHITEMGETQLYFLPYTPMTTNSFSVTNTLGPNPSVVYEGSTDEIVYIVEIPINTYTM